MQSSKLNLAVLVSGTGSLLESLLSDGVPYEVSLILADRRCRGIDQVPKLFPQCGAETLLLERFEFGASFNRHAYTSRIIEALREHNIDVVAMMGFQTILGLEIFEYYHGRIVNIHPSLLPRFKGHCAVRDALAAGVAETGTTLHVATAKLDDGPIIAQESVPILSTDIEDSLHERIKQVERVMYPRELRKFMLGLSPLRV